METFMYIYLVAIIIVNLYFIYAERASIIKALKWFYKELEETGANAGYAMRR